jgi:hypothetical protein
LITHFTFSQDNRLFDNNWYLTNVIKDGTNHPPVVQSGVNFYQQQQPSFIAYGCLSIIGDATFENNTTDFSITNLQYCLCWCTNPAADAYDGLYFSVFSQNNFDTQNVTYYTYAINELGNNERSLVITSSLNEQAIYSNVPLSNAVFNKKDFSLYPNPATDFIVIDLKNEKTENTKIEIYNELGALCKSLNLNLEGKVDIKDLAVGVYFMKIKLDNELITKKFIKI